MDQRRSDNKAAGENDPSSTSEAASIRRKSVLQFVSVAAIIGVVMGTYWHITRYGLIGFDSYPIILTSRVQSVGDLVGNFTEKLMDGRYTGDFYRPLLNLSFALDYAAWGLRPLGYQLTNLALFAGCALALYGLVRRLTGRGSWLAPVVAALYFVLHPAQFEVVPVPPRRAETMCCMLMALALFTQLSPIILAMRRPPILPGIITLLAIGAKETALIVPLLIFLAVVLYSPRYGIRPRVLHAAVASIVPVVAVALMLTARWLVLGGMGGHEPRPLADVVTSAPQSAWAIAANLIFPQPVMRESATFRSLLVALAVGLTLTAGLTTTYRRRTNAPRRTGPPLISAAIVALFWMLPFMTVGAAAGRIEVWYAMLPATGLAILVGVAAAGLVAAIRQGPALLRIPAVPSVLLMGAFIGWQVRYAPLFQPYDEYERATATGDQFLAELERRIRYAANGSIVHAPLIPVWIAPRQDRPAIRGATVLVDYSIQAWAELTFPNRRITVLPRTPQTPKPAADEILVLVEQKMQIL